MKTYDDIKTEILEFLKTSGMSSFDLVRVAKDLCTCAQCKYFIQHYDKDGKEVCCGHCIHGNTVRSRKPYQQSCGSWELKEMEDD